MSKAEFLHKQNKQLPRAPASEGPPISQKKKKLVNENDAKKNNIE